MFVDKEKILQGFAMVKELQIQEKKEYLQYQQSMDSIRLLLADNQDSSVKEYLFQELAKQQSVFKQSSQDFSNQTYTNVWNRISGYAKDFSKHRGYDFIMGVAPGENVLYGAEGLDITNQFLTYINKRYEGVE
ncbi:OmpH family outer membrane protein [Flavobacterium rhizosphaerae]|uniref:OmpH family outer membrane protein n=1 Tax=Flavobacterium rhizosphaerae TaxID=3163298 RepID=A0ABW8YWL5_9FLAO